MTISFWNHNFSHKHLSNLPQAEVLKRLENFYSQKKPKTIDKTEFGLKVEKGSILVSFICIGPETWCRNNITITTKVIDSGTEIIFDINLKFPGITMGKNFLIEEALSACDTL